MQVPPSAQGTHAPDGLHTMAVPQVVPAGRMPASLQTSRGRAAPGVTTQAMTPAWQGVGCWHEPPARHCTSVSRGRQVYCVSVEMSVGAVPPSAEGVEVRGELEVAAVPELVAGVEAARARRGGRC